jgi:hypothetical protein
MKRIALLCVLLTGALLAPTTGFAQISCTREGLQRAVDLYVAAQTNSRADVAVAGRVELPDGARAAGASAARRRRTLSGSSHPSQRRVRLLAVGERQSG